MFQWCFYHNQSFNQFVAEYRCSLRQFWLYRQKAQKSFNHTHFILNAWFNLIRVFVYTDSKRIETNTEKTWWETDTKGLDGKLTQKYFIGNWHKWTWWETETKVLSEKLSQMDLMGNWHKKGLMETDTKRTCRKLIQKDLMENWHKWTWKESDTNGLILNWHKRIWY